MGLIIVILSVKNQEGITRTFNIEKYTEKPAKDLTLQPPKAPREIYDNNNQIDS